MKWKLHCLFFNVAIFCSAWPTFGKEKVAVEIYSPVAKSFFPDLQHVEQLSNGYRLAEGPVWNRRKACLLFVDIPANTVYRWTKRDGVSIYLTPSGRTGFAPSLERGVIGANGLAFDSEQSLVLCQHGDRRIAKLSNPGGAKPEFVTLASHFQGKRFNSPNDLTIAANGDIFFTDPPGGYLDLEKSDFAQGRVVFDTRHKELLFQGVYHYHANSQTISLVTQKMNRPNGIALSLDGKRLYVGNAEGNNPHIMQFSTDTYEGEMFFDGPFREEDDGVVDDGVVDGMKVHSSGILFVTGPGGIHLLSNEGTRLAQIRLDQPVTNLCFDPEEEHLYFTTHHAVARLKINRVSKQTP